MRSKQIHEVLSGGLGPAGGLAAHRSPLVLLLGAVWQHHLEVVLLGHAVERIGLALGLLEPAGRLLGVELPA